MYRPCKAKGLQLLFSLAIIIFLFPAIIALAAQPILITVDGRPLSVDAPPVMRDNRVLVPLRGIFEALGATVRWDAGTQTITGSRGDRTVILTIGNRQATVNGNSVSLDVPPAVIGGRTMVPVRFIADGLGARATWDAHLRTVSIRTDGVIPAAPTTPAIAVRQAVVTGITDGDTIRVNIGGQAETVRLIGVDTPESTREVEPFGKEAAAFTRRRLDGKTVFLEIDVSERDRFGRLLAYVWLARPAADNEAEVRAKMFNAELLLQGYAQIMTIAPNVKYADMFLRFEREARNAGKGLWAVAPPVVLPGEPVSGVVIASVDLAAEVVMLENRSRASIDISGWVLVSENGNQRFTFPQGTTIPAGGSIRVVSGPNATAGTGRLLWTRLHIWNNDGDPAVLLDGSGREISRR
jgi:endonuclease YncB( thermonuclease family)